MESSINTEHYFLNAYANNTPGVFARLIFFGSKVSESREVERMSFFTKE